MMKKKVIIGAVILAVIIAVIVYATGRKAVPPSPRAVPVTAAKAVQKDMPLEINEIGTVEGFRSVPIVTRVVGQLVKIHFREGQDVRKGDLLFTIDPNPYKEKLKQAEAKLAQDVAQQMFNRDEAERYRFLYEKGAAAKSDADNKKAIADGSDAIVAADRSAVDDARLQLAYCYIHAPFDGRMGAYAVYEGRMVKDNDTQLAVINQIVPVYVTFSVPEKDLPRIRTHSGANQLRVRALLPAAKEKVPEGELTFIDNTVNTQTGMITLKATFPNKDRFLWPGQFVTASLVLTVERGVTVVPEKAVQLSQEGKYAFVVKPDNKVERRTVTTDRTMRGETIVLKGINPGETVVTDGHLKLNDGYPVAVLDSLIPRGSNTQNGAGGSAK